MRKFIVVVVALTALACAPGALAATSPTVAATATTSIGQTSATLNGTVNPQGLATTYQFDYGLTDALGTYAPIPATSAGSGTAAVAAHGAIKSLVPGTTYYFELVATNSAGATSTTPIETFKTTGAPPPLVTTGAATLVGRYGATFNGSITTNDATTTFYFQYGLTANYGEQTMPLTLAAGTAAVAVTNVMAGLQPGVIFHYRLVATHGTTSTVYGADTTFLTQPWPRPQTALHFNITPRRDTTAPYVFGISGHVALPLGIPAASLACGGVVRLRLLEFARQLASTTVKVNADCTYTGSVRLSQLPRTGKHHSVKTLTAEVNYGGDTYEAPSKTGRVSVAVH